MAELTTDTHPRLLRAREQTTCCEPSAKDDCCATRGCGCGARPRAGADVREEVASATPPPRVARASASGGRRIARAAAQPRLTTDALRPAGLRRRAVRRRARPHTAPDAAVAASLGCGVPTAVADLKEGETVLDLGSGAGADVLISARRVGPTGRAIGLDMTDEMLELARGNAEKAGVENVEFHKGYIEEIPLPDASVDVVISNCVLNLSGDKPQVIREAARVLRPGGRFAISDVIADEDMDDATRADMQQWTGCIAGALTRAGVRGRPSATPGSWTSRSARRTASTTRPPRRSSARASRAEPRHEHHERGSPARPADALPPLGGEPVEPVGDRPVRRPRAVGGDGGPHARLLRPRLADGRRGADHDQVLRPRRARTAARRKSRSSPPSRSTRPGTCSSTRASRTRSSRSLRSSPRTSSAPVSRSRPRSERSSTTSSSRPTSASSPTPPTPPRRSRS